LVMGTSSGAIKRLHPLWARGDIVGEFYVIRHMGWNKENPETGRVLQNAYHWYKVRCYCSRVEVPVAEFERLQDAASKWFAVEAVYRELHDPDDAQELLDCFAEQTNI